MSESNTNSNHAKSRRGRPPGSRNIGYIRRTEKWEPKKWKPVYEQMIYLHVLGKSNTEIGAEYGYTDQQISNILNSVKGQEVKSALLEKGRQHFLDASEVEQDALVQAAQKNLKDVLTDDMIKAKAPLALFDRSLNFLKAAGKLVGEKEDKRTQNNIFIGADVAKVLAEGIQKANLVTEMHTPKQLPKST